MAPKPYRAQIRQHAGSTAQDIPDEPDWRIVHQHRIGYRYREDGKTGLTHTGGMEACATTSFHRSLEILQMRRRNSWRRRSKTRGKSLERKCKYPRQKIALLRSLQHGKPCVRNLQQNDGRKNPPPAKTTSLISIDEADQFTSDYWIPRPTNLIRTAGKHSLSKSAPAPNFVIRRGCPRYPDSVTPLADFKK